MRGIRAGQSTARGQADRIWLHMRAAGRSRFAPKIGHHRELSSGARLDRRRVVLEVSVADDREPRSSDVSRFSAVGLARTRLTIWMQTTGVALLVVKRCSVVSAWMPAQDSRSAHGLLYLAAVRSDRHHLLRRLCHAHPLPAHFVADLPRCYSLVRSRWRR